MTARMAGTSVAASDTTIASPTTSATVLSEIAGAPAAPMRAAPGLVTSGETSQPATSPTTAAKSASTRFSTRNVAATTLGVAADGLQESDPTRVLRQPAPDEDGHARDREQREQQRPRLKHPLPVLDQLRILRRDPFPGRDRERVGLEVLRRRTPGRRWGS